MKQKMIIMAAISGCLTFVLVACGDGKQDAGGTSVISKDSLVKRGSYLVNGMGCDDCHSPKKMGAHGPELDMDKRFGGAGFMPMAKVDSNTTKGWVLSSMDATTWVGPWGTSFAANISSDDTGIGGWTEEQFIRCIREGKSKGLADGRPLLPPMPWPVFRNLNDDDLRSIYAYLKTTKPIHNVVSGPKAPGQM